VRTYGFDAALQRLVSEGLETATARLLKPLKAAGDIGIDRQRDLHPSRHRKNRTLTSKGLSEAGIGKG
jgi:hypothetical protein